jgi:hypothetical protein
MSQQQRTTLLLRLNLRTISLLSAHGSAESARQSMDDRQQLLTILILVLFIGGVVMGLMVNG